MQQHSYNTRWRAFQSKQTLFRHFRYFRFGNRIRVRSIGERERKRKRNPTGFFCQFTVVVSLISAESEVWGKSALVAPEGSSERKFAAFLCSQVLVFSLLIFLCIPLDRDLSRSEQQLLSARNINLVRLGFVVTFCLFY